MSAFGAMPLTIIKKRERQKKSRLTKNMDKTAARVVDQKKTRSLK
jgi:tRNA A37 threonylcarbamoyladenosine synthetase subunit TsaC/SUA5/YrdC